MTQIKNKFLEDSSVDGRVIRLKNGDYLRARNAANNADVNLMRLTPADEFEINRQLQADAALPVPSAPKHYVTVEYVQNVINGKQDPKEAVYVLSTVNVPLTGATPLTIDGVLQTADSNIGLIGQTDATQNGPYIYSEAGGTYTLTRRADFDSDAEVSKGAYFPVTGGSTYAGYQVILTTDNPITIDTTPLTFVAYPSALSIEAGDMLVKTGNVLSVDLASLSGLESSNPGNVSGQLRVKVDTAVAEKDKSTRIDPSTGAVVARKARKFVKTLTGADITNQYVDLADVAGQDSIKFAVAGAGEQYEGVDYNVNYTGGVSSKTRISFAGGLATAGVSALVAGDVVIAYYDSFV